MTLYEALLSTPGERICAIAAFYGLALPEVPRSAGAEAEAAARVASHLLVPANAVVAMKGLNQEEILALRLITVAAGGFGVVVEQCHQKLNQLSRKWRRNGAKVINALISRGLVYTRREDYRHVYFVPSDLRSVLADFFLSDIFKESAFEDPKFNPRHRLDAVAPLRHICLFLSYLRKNEVKLTQSGTIFKKAQNDLSPIIEEDETAMGGTLFPIRYPPRLAFLLYFAKSRNLVEETDGAIQPGANVEDWMRATYTQWRQDLFDYWQQSFVAQDTDLQTLLWIIMMAPENSVLSLESLLSEMDTLSTSHSSHGLSLRVEKNLVDFLEYLGGLEVATNINGTFVRPTALGRALFGSDSQWPQEVFDQHVYVQSNFEILVPCTIAPRLLWAVDGFADLVKPDQMMVYRLSRDSMYRALAHSYRPDIVQDFLKSRSKTPIPQNVAYSISHWGTSYGRVEFEEAMLLKCDVPELADELMLSPKIRPHLKGRVGPCHLVVDRNSYDRLVTALSEEGYMPKLGGPGHFSLGPEIAADTQRA